jgi:hypothetical protein
VPSAADFANRVSSNDVLKWRKAVDAAFALPPDEREAALRVIRPVYESRLTPQFHAVPWGGTLHERSDFRTAYESAKKLTDDFKKTSEAELRAALEADPSTLAVFRLILGYTIPELVSALELLNVPGATRSTIAALEHGGQMTPARAAVLAGVAMAVTQVIGGKLFALDTNLPAGDFKSRLDKIDTEAGWQSVRQAAAGGVDYGDLLYERYVDGPWLAVRSAYSEKKGRLIEDAVADLLTQAKIGFDQSPDELVRQARPATRRRGSPPSLLPPRPRAGRRWRSSTATAGSGGTHWCRPSKRPTG